MTSLTLEMSDQPKTREVKGLRRGIVLLSLPVFCFFFMLLGHDFDRSLLLDDGFNLDDAEMQERVEEGMLKYRLAFVGIGFAGAALLVLPGGDGLRIRPVLAVSIAFTLFWALGSVIWSGDPSLTIRRNITLICSFVGMLGVARFYRAIDMCLLGFLFPLAMAALGLFAEMVLGTFQPWQSGYRFAGLVHPNTQGLELSILILSGLVLQARYPRWRAAIFFVIAMAFLGLLLTKSRTSTACCFLGIIALWLVNTNARVKFVSAALVFLLVSITAGTLLTLGVDDADSLGNVLRMGRDDDHTSLTGRVPIWIALMEEVGERPLAGAGFNSYFDEDALAYLATQHEWAVPNAHNAYIEYLLNLGYIGLVSLLLTLLIALVMFGMPEIRAADTGYSLIFALILLGLLNGGFESIMVINFNFPPCLAAAGILRLAFFENGNSDQDNPETPQGPVRRWS